MKNIPTELKTVLYTIALVAFSTACNGEKDYTDKPSWKPNGGNDRVPISEELRRFMKKNNLNVIKFQDGAVTRLLADKDGNLIPPCGKVVQEKGNKIIGDCSSLQSVTVEELTLATKLVTRKNPPCVVEYEGGGDIYTYHKDTGKSPCP